MGWAKSDFKAATARVKAKSRHSSAPRGRVLKKGLKTRDKTCKICKDKFTPRTTVQPVCFKPSCILEYSAKLREKREKSEWKVKKAILIEKTKTLGDVKKDLQLLVNKIARLVDLGVGCIATGATTGKQNGGHYTSVSANSTIRFNLHNIFLQSEHSNSYRAGDTIKYQEGIRRLYGQPYLDFMDSLRAHPPVHLTKDDLKEKIAVAREIVRELEKENRTYNVKERIQKRNEVNKKLGIYQNKFATFNY